MTFYGTRGSTPISGADYIRYGGNTTCIALRAGDRLIIVDCGTGLLALQRDLFDSGRYREADIFITHLHWDHIQGVAFFAPFFIPSCGFDLYGEDRYGTSLRGQIDGIMNSPMFPIMADAFNARMDYHPIVCGQSLDCGEVRVETARLEHPNVCTGYRFTYQGQSVAVVSDFEHHKGYPLELARGADLLIYDAQYTDGEYPAKVGWGHSTWSRGVELARQSGAARLALTHHAPDHTDDRLDQMQEEARAVMPQAVFARDGMTIAL